MRHAIRLPLVPWILLGGWVAPAPQVDAASLHTTADHVFGQPDFTHNTLNNGGLGANSLARPDGVSLDAHGNLYVADTSNSRALE